MQKMIEESAVDAIKEEMFKTLKGTGYEAAWELEDYPMKLKIFPEAGNGQMSLVPEEPKGSCTAWHTVTGTEFSAGKAFRMDTAIFRKIVKLFEKGCMFYAYMCHRVAYGSEVK